MILPLRCLYQGIPGQRQGWASTALEATEVNDLCGQTFMA